MGVKFILRERATGVRFGLHYTTFLEGLEGVTRMVAVFRHETLATEPMRVMTMDKFQEQFELVGQETV